MPSRARNRCGDHSNPHLLLSAVSHHRELNSVTMSNPIDKIRNYAVEARGWRDQEMETDASDARTEARLDQTIKELQERLRARKLELEKVGILLNLPPAINCRNGRPSLSDTTPYEGRH